MSTEHQVQLNPISSWLLVAVLTIIGTLNYADRELPFIMAEQIKSDLAINDTTLALVTSFGFLVVYALAGVFLARIADKGFPGLVIVGSLLVWSGMTGLSALATTALFMALARTGVAFGEAGNTPASHALIASWFPSNARALPLAILTMAAPVGSAISLIVGGHLAQMYGWRITFFVFALVGVILTPLVLLVLHRHGVLHIAVGNREPKPLFREIGGLLLRRSYRDLLIAKAMWAMATYAMIAFVPAFLMRTRGMTLGEVSTQFGIAKGILSVTVLLFIGYLANSFSRQSITRLPQIPVLMAAVAIPLTVAGIAVADSLTSVILLGAANAIGVAMLAPSIAVMQCVVPPEARASASAVFLLVVSLAGATGPLLTGILSDLMSARAGPSSIMYGLMIAPVLKLGAILMFLRMSRRFAEDLVE